MLDVLIAWGVLIASPVALFGAACTLNAMHHRQTRWRIILPFWLIAFGWIALLFAALDFLAHNQPRLWPWALLSGVLLLAVGNAVLFMVNRRQCSCPGCPVRKTERES